MGQSDPSDQGSATELTEARELRAFYRAVGDTIRLQILRLLAMRGEMSVTQLAQVLHVSQPLLSWHLGVLRRIQLVNVRKEGRMGWYSLNRAAFQAFDERFEAWIGEHDE